MQIEFKQEDIESLSIHRYPESGAWCNISFKKKRTNHIERIEGTTFLDVLNNVNKFIKDLKK